MILENGIDHMCLVLTNECNLRCRYCIYSEHYYYSRPYSNRKMEFEVAKKAVDYYFRVNDKSIEYNPYIMPSIGFYGGEPLLAWDVIVKVVNYIKNKTDKCLFSITTNGLLLDIEKIKFMLKNNFAISISLDGTKEEHDRNRIDQSSNGSFERVYNNLELYTKKT